MAVIIKHYGDSATLTAVPNTGYYFTGWSGDITGTVNPYTINSVTQNFDVVAHFDNHYTIAVAKTEGTVTGSTIAIQGQAGTSASLTYGTSCTVIATAASGVSFSGWYNGATLVSTSASYTFSVSGDVTLTAHFSDIEYTLTVNSNPAAGGEVIFDAPTPTVKNIISYTIGWGDPGAQPLTGTWIQNNTDTSLNEFDSSTGQGKLYLTTDVIGGGPSTAYSPFYNRADLTNIEILGPSEEYGGPDATLTTVGDYAFYGCTDLWYPALPDSVTTIGDYAFANSGYYEGNFNVSIIGAHAFDGCSDNFSSVSFGSGFDPENNRPVTSVGPGAFFNVNPNVEIWLNETPTPPTCTGAIFNQSTITVKVPQGSLSAYQANQYWNVVNLAEFD
jgi:uncharacterized repeat protein (TIGR02543 family)